MASRAGEPFLPVSGYSWHSRMATRTWLTNHTLTDHTITDHIITVHTVTNHIITDHTTPDISYESPPSHHTLTSHTLTSHTLTSHFRITFFLAKRERAPRSDLGCGDLWRVREGLSHFPVFFCSEHRVSTADAPSLSLSRLSPRPEALLDKFSSSC